MIVNDICKMLVSRNDNGACILVPRKLLPERVLSVRLSNLKSEIRFLDSLGNTNVKIKNKLVMKRTQLKLGKLLASSWKYYILIDKCGLSTERKDLETRLAFVLLDNFKDIPMDIKVIVKVYDLIYKNANRKERSYPEVTEDLVLKSMSKFLQLEPLSKLTQIGDFLKNEKARIIRKTNF